jgi:hypothetical protein
MSFISASVASVVPDWKVLVSRINSHVEHGALDGRRNHVRDLVRILRGAGLQQQQRVLGRCHGLLLEVVVRHVLIELGLRDHFLSEQPAVTLDVGFEVPQADARREQLRLRGVHVHHVGPQRDARNDGALFHGLAGDHVEALDHTRDLRLHFDLAARNHLARGDGLAHDGHAHGTIHRVLHRLFLRLPIEEEQGAEKHQHHDAKADPLEDSFHYFES